ncbi:hypothetical protein BDDG_12504 [Blastomyces dermatitidis ATCC 18188]|uniref:Uncharacterized protein n=1 Tax=Ajellomyces dermatitidis (strain ATCC 18188 / CBS 674.68) TaxID=653446 RepID=A0A0J9EPQ5_AJEDA|nr:hypothetical protein BDDG_12504 [Blastomyces dermatitidis ATCC 18188]
MTATHQIIKTHQYQSWFLRAKCSYGLSYSVSIPDGQEPHKLIALMSSTNNKPSLPHLKGLQPALFISSELIRKLEGVN